MIDGNWSYAARFRAICGNRTRREIAEQLTKLLGRKVGSSQIYGWERGSRPRAAHIIEKWVREHEPAKPLVAPRPHVGLSFSLFLDTTTAEEAARIVALLEGIVAVIRTRWPPSVDPSPAEKAK